MLPPFLGPKNERVHFSEMLESIWKSTGYEKSNAVYFSIIFSHRIEITKLTNSVAQEPEGSSPHSQQPATCPYPEPVESNPHPPSQYP
jgi:hypothetical protein